MSDVPTVGHDDDSIRPHGGRDAWVPPAAALIRTLTRNDGVAVLVASLSRLFAKTEVGTFLIEPGTNTLRSAQPSSNAVIRPEAVELAYQEGPCVATARSGRAILNEPLDHSVSSWPTFAPAAQAAGFVLVSSLPMIHGRTTYGAVNLFQRTGAHIRPEALRMAMDLIASVGSP